MGVVFTINGNWTSHICLWRFERQTCRSNRGKNMKKRWNLGVCQNQRDRHIVRNSPQYITCLEMRKSNIWRFVSLGFNSYPIGSMYAIYGNIYHQYTPNVSIYIYHTWIQFISNVALSNKKCSWLVIPPVTWGWKDQHEIGGQCPNQNLGMDHRYNPMSFNCNSDSNNVIHCII